MTPSNFAYPAGGKERDRFWSRVKDLGKPRPRIKGFGKRDALWLEPGLTAQVRHLKGEHKLRHASVRSLSRG